jgi:ATP-dependent Clp protease ATP-binding subunit ClpA
MPKYVDSLKSAYKTTGQPTSSASLLSKPPPQQATPSSSRLDGIVDISLVSAEKPPPQKLNEAALLADWQAEVVGQKQALESITTVISTHIGKRKPRRPPAFMMAGPTGTGKTSAVEHLAELLPNHTGLEWGYIRVNANQMSERHTVSRLIGAPPGYVGYQDTPMLAPIMKNPHYILLFDEIEKADPEIMVMLMSILDSGKMDFYKPVNGKITCDFRKTLIFFTSNLPVFIKDAKEKTAMEISRAARDQLTKPIGGRAGMPPEIAARLTEIVLFRELSETDKVEILALSMLRVADQFELEIRDIDTALLQDVVDKSNLSNGAREPQYALDNTLGKALNAFASEHDCKDVALSGTIEQVVVKPYTA